MLAYMSKHMFKSNNFAAITSLKSTHLCFLNSTHRYLSKNVSSKVTRIKGLFENYGFTDTQVSKLINKFPSLNVRIAKPKLDYFCSFGFKSNDLCQILKNNRRILLRCSLNNRIIPSCEFLKSLLKDNARVIVAVRRNSRVLTRDISKTVRPNAEFLLNLGVHEYRIWMVLKERPATLLQGNEKFRATVEEIKELGFHPEKRSFLDAIQIFAALSKSTRERKWDLFRKWGLPDDEILSAVRKQPFMMTVSEEKIERVMDFLVNKMGWTTSQVLYRPLTLKHSLENWTIPRCLVVKFLLSKGVLKENLTLSSFIGMSEEDFRKRFVDEFCVDFPEVITLYGSPDDNAKKLSRKVTTKKLSVSLKLSK